jgi:glyoxylase-like metal-dependent hydrolase (beta-lactamase superfamily II)/ferredoxin
MAERRLALPANVAGDYFVDSTCIDCDACRLLAPAVFGRSGGQSFVRKQPGSPGEQLAAARALVACPTASIGAVEADVAAAVRSFPMPIEGDVSLAGFTSEKSFGAFPWLIERPEGNVLIDSPRFTRPLVRALEQRGGLALIALTHRDDVADHAQWASHFGARRVLHRRDVGPSTAGVEMQPEGDEEIEIAPDLRMIPTPGHTRGHAVFLYQQRYLFTGDHLAWRADGGLYAFRDACWYSWGEQIASMERLRGLQFEWVLPGHGGSVHLDAGAMQASLEGCIEWMRAVA